ncbi:hypothetical protein BGX33_002105, partial [Mortierella sp. NVP41]
MASYVYQGQVFVVEEATAAGGSASIYRAIHNNQNYALKVHLDVDRWAWNKEVGSLSVLAGQRNIIGYYGHFQQDRYLCLILQWAPNTLFQLGKLRPTVDEFKLVARGLVQGVKQMHDRKILHRDLNLANILFRGNDVKITDFGISYRFPPESDMLDKMSTIVVGAPGYMAPEMERIELYGYALDMWGIRKSSSTCGEKQLDLKEADEIITNLTLDQQCAQFTANEVLQEDFFRYMEPVVWSAPTPWPPVEANLSVAQGINDA